MKVADCGSFTKAALSLDTVHSGLSRQVLELEEQLGYRLLQRTGRGVRLTEHGERLYNQARHLIAVAQSVEDEARALHGVPLGTVTMGMPGSVALLLGSRLLIEASHKYPQVKIRLIEGLSGSVEEMLAVGRVDLALYFASPERKPQRGTTLFLSDLYLIGSPADPLMQLDAIGASQLAGLRLILPGRPHAIRVAVEEACAAASVSCEVGHEADSLSTMKRAVEQGAGYTVASWDSVAREVSAGLLRAVKLVNPVLTRALVLELAPQQPLTIAARVIHEEIGKLATRFLGDPSLRLRTRPPA